MKKLLVFTLFAFGFIFPVVGNSAPLDIELPQNCLGYAYVPRAEEAMNHLSSFATELNLPNSTIIFIKSALAVILENRDMKGINWKGPIGVVLLQQDQENPWAIGVQLSAPDSYYRELARSFTLKSEDKKNGIRVYTKQEKVFDTLAYQEASGEEKKKSKQFFKTEEKQLILSRRGDYAWVSANPELINSLNKIAPPDLKVFEGIDFTFVFEAEPILDLLRSRLDQELPAILTAVPGTKFSRASIQPYLDLYFHYAQQVKRVAFGLTADEKGVSLEKMVTAESGSVLGEFLRLQKNGKLSLARYLDPRAWLIFDGRVNQAQMLIEPYRKLARAGEEFLGKMAPESRSRLPELRQATLSTIQSYLNNLGGEMAVCISSSPSGLFSSLMVQEIKDPKAYRNYLSRELPASLEKFRELYHELGITYDPGGLLQPVDRIYTLKMTCDMEKFPPGKPTSKPGKKLRLSFFNKPIISRFTLREGLAISATSWGGESKLASVLQRVEKGKEGVDLALLSPCYRNANGLIYFSFNHYLAFLDGIIKQMETAPEGKRLEKLQELAGIDLPLLICWKVQGETLSVRTGISMENIRKVKNLFSGGAPEKD